MRLLWGNSLKVHRLECKCEISLTAYIFITSRRKGFADKIYERSIRVLWERRKKYRHVYKNKAVNFDKSFT